MKPFFILLLGQEIYSRYKKEKKLEQRKTLIHKYLGALCIVYEKGYEKTGALIWSI
jgi:hypothetical protein